MAEDERPSIAFELVAGVHAGVFTSLTVLCVNFVIGVLHLDGDGSLVACIVCPGWVTIWFLVLQMVLGGAMAGLGVGVVEWLAARGRERAAVLVALLGPVFPFAVGFYADEFRMAPDSIGASLSVAQMFWKSSALGAAALGLGLVGAWVFALPAIARARGASLRQEVILALVGALVVVHALIPAALDGRFDDALTFTAFFGAILPAAVFSRLYCARGRVVASRVLSWLGQEVTAHHTVRPVAGGRLVLALALTTVSFAWALGAVPHVWFPLARWTGSMWPFFRGPWRGDDESSLWLGACTSAWLALQVARGLDRPVSRAEIRTSAAIMLGAAAVRLSPSWFFGHGIDIDYPPPPSGIAIAAGVVLLVLAACAVSGRREAVRGALVALGAASGALVLGAVLAGGVTPLELFSGRATCFYEVMTWPESPDAIVVGGLAGGVAAALLARLGRAGTVTALVLGLAAVPSVVAVRASRVLGPSVFYWDGAEPKGTPLSAARAFDAGIGVPEVLDEANLRYERAAATGDREALYRLALRLERGSRIPIDRARAKSLLERAASLGSAEAASHLAIAAQPSEEK